MDDEVDRAIVAYDDAIRKSKIAYLAALAVDALDAARTMQAFLARTEEILHDVFAEEYVPGIPAYRALVSARRAATHIERTADLVDRVYRDARDGNTDVPAVLARGTKRSRDDDE